MGAGILLAVLILAVHGSRHPGPSAGQGSNSTLVYFDGSRASLADFKGKPLVVNFWASWCGSCIAELPRFERVYESHRAQVEFLGVNLQDDPVAAGRLRLQTGITYPLARDAQGALYRSFGGYAMPTTVLLGPNGQVRKLVTGEVSAEELDGLIEHYLLAPASS